MYVHEISEMMISNNTIKWDTDVLETLFNPFPLGNYSYEYSEVLCFLLNSGIVTCELQYYVAPENPDKHSELAKWYKRCLRMGRNSPNGDLWWNGFCWLYKEGFQEIFILENSSILYDRSLSMYLKVGRGNPEKIINQYFSNGNSYIHIPTHVENNEMFIFKTTDKYKKFYEDFKMKKVEERREHLSIFRD